MKLKVFNTGKKVNINIINDVETETTCGKLFGFIKENKDDLRIKYYSIATSKLETVYKSLIEDTDSKNSHDCTVI